jgi:hypothetical protein
MSLGADCPYKSSCSNVDDIVFRAGPGEANDLQVTVDDKFHKFADAGARLVAGEGCSAVDNHTVRCAPRYGVRSLEIDLGDGNDRAHAADAKLIGGDGDDALSGGTGLGGEGDDRLSGPGLHEGGPGNDHLVGSGRGGPGDDVIDASKAKATWVSTLGPGADVYVGGPGDDWVETDEPGEAARDRIDGGGGIDTIGYGQSPVPVSVDLAAASQAPAHDDVSGFEKVHGSAHADTLRGSEASDLLHGNRGDDVLEGRGGNDALDGEDGRDRLDGGPGDDLAAGGSGADEIFTGSGDDRVFAAADFYRDVIDCGPGADFGDADSGDARTGCEPRLALRRPERVLGYDPIQRAPGGRYRLTYQWCDKWPSCTGTSRLRALVRGRRVRLPDVRFAGHRRVVELRSTSFRLPARAARELRRRGRLRIDVTTLVDPGTAGAVLPAEQRIVLRAPA